jgi:hypothetical protein
MGLFSRFERHMENGLEGAADKMFDAPISPVQISKKAEKAMRQEKMVGAGKQYAPTLYTVLVNPEDDKRLFGYYPTLAGETETYLQAKAQEEGLLLDGQPLVRFIVDDDLKHGKFDIIAEMVSAPIIKQLREEEMARYGIGNDRPVGQAQNFEQDNYRHVTGAHSHTAKEQEALDAQVQARRPIAHNAQPVPAAPRRARHTSAVAPVSNPAPSINDVPPITNVPSIHEDGNRPAYAAERDMAPGNGWVGGQNQPIYESSPANARGAASQAAATQFIGAQQGGGVAQPVRLTNMSTNRIENLDPGTYTLGRGADANIAVSDINASRMHAQLQSQGDGSWVITDLDSTNGTKVNGKRVSNQVLHEGDRITIGLTNYLFTYRR